MLFGCTEEPKIDNGWFIEIRQFVENNKINYSEKDGKLEIVFTSQSLNEDLISLLNKHLSRFDIPPIEFANFESDGLAKTARVNGCTSEWRFHFWANEDPSPWTAQVCEWCDGELNGCMNYYY